MPHQCTNCGRTFDDGSKEMLSGCPDCGGNKFQFRPDGADGPASTETEPPDPEPRGAESTVARTVGKTAATVRDIVGGEEPRVGAPDSTGTTGVDRPDVQATDAEDAAQASARADVVSPDELPEAPEPDTESEDAAAPDDAESAERPDLKELREELNQQFESIKVLEPGQYELNLMELYDREEYIVALQEDGRYSIQVPESFRE